VVQQMLNTQAPESASTSPVGATQDIQRPDAVAKLGERFDALKGQLELIQTCTAELRTTAHWTTALEDYFEAKADLVLADMQTLSKIVAAAPAQTLPELRHKARILLQRCVPNSTDDASELAVSLCRDILAVPGDEAASVKS
jgi:hypothetical protein